MLARPSLKSLAEFYAQKRRLHELAFDLAERPGLEGYLSKRLYYLRLLCEQYERTLRPQLLAAGRCLDEARSRVVAEQWRAFRARHGITCCRAATAEELAALGFADAGAAERPALLRADTAHLDQLARERAARQAKPVAFYGGRSPGWA